MFNPPSFVLLLSILFSFDIITCVNTTDQETDQPICSDDSDSLPPFLLSEEPNDPISYHTYLQSQQHEIFVPFKILFLIDDQISIKEREKLIMSTQYVNDRISKIIRARSLADVRLVLYRTNLNCSVCGGRTSYPEEYQTRCYAPNEQVQIGANASEQVAEQSRQNFTLVVRVLVNGEGITRGGTMQIRCGRQLAYAGACALTQKRGPTHGHMIFCKKPSEFKNENQLKDTTLHELMHVLIPAFSFHYSNIQHYNCSNATTCEGKTWKTYIRNETKEDGSTETVKGFLAIADPLPTIAKKHFHCDEAEGIELHYSTENGTLKQSDHWSEHMFPDELLAPADASLSHLSALTLGAIASYKNWYRVDMSFAEELSISRPSAAMGCDILNKSYWEIIREQRAKGGVQRFRPYCDNSRGAERAITNHCSDDHKRRYVCIAKNSRAFLTTNRAAYDTDVCAVATRMDSTTAQVPYHTGAWYGSGTICVTFTNIPGSFRDQTNAVCVLHECKTDTRVLVLKFFSNNWTTSDEECFVQCSSDASNQIVTVERKPSCTNMLQGSTSIICPDYEVVCEGKPGTTTSVTLTKQESPFDRWTSSSETDPTAGSDTPTGDYATSAVIPGGGGGDFHDTSGVSSMFLLAAYICAYVR